MAPVALKWAGMGGTANCLPSPYLTLPPSPLRRWAGMGGTANWGKASSDGTLPLSFGGPDFGGAPRNDAWVANMRRFMEADTTAAGRAPYASRLFRTIERGLAVAAAAAAAEELPAAGGVAAAAAAAEELPAADGGVLAAAAAPSDVVPATAAAADESAGDALLPPK